MSPAVWYSRDGVEWGQVLELSEDHGWINGILLTDDALIVSTTVPTDGWVCPEIEGSRYEIHRGAIER